MSEQTFKKYTFDKDAKCSMPVCEVKGVMRVYGKLESACEDCRTKCPTCSTGKVQFMHGDTVPCCSECKASEDAAWLLASARAQKQTFRSFEEVRANRIRTTWM